jgi:hypothetical protein
MFRLKNNVDLFSFELPKSFSLSPVFVSFLFSRPSDSRQLDIALSSLMTIPFHFLYEFLGLNDLFFYIFALKRPYIFMSLFTYVALKRENGNWFLLAIVSPTFLPNSN